ncbi:hypothetical protein HDE_06386 [Halotydeus destructor]|nr:hypothetical protein HDE_06386 [Halotydeus destructor]
MKTCFLLIALSVACAYGQESSTQAPNKREKKQTREFEFFKADAPESHHGHGHHHHPDAHFTHGNHEHVGTDQVFPAKPSLLVVRTEHKEPEVKVIAVQPERVAHYHHREEVSHIPNGHVHHSDSIVHVHPEAHKAPPGYPSSDYTKYFAKYTSRGGDPKEAAHSYYRAHDGHLYNYDVEPEFTAPRQVKLAHIRAEAPRSSPSRSSQRNFVASGRSYHSSASTGEVDSPSGRGPITGFYFGNQPLGGRLLAGDTQIRF